MSRASRRLLEETPVGDILVFSNDSMVLPEDLKKCIDSYWKGKKEVEQAVINY